MTNTIKLRHVQTFSSRSFLNQIIIGGSLTGLKAIEGRRCEVTINPSDIGTIADLLGSIGQYKQLRDRMNQNIAKIARRENTRDKHMDCETRAKDMYDILSGAIKRGDRTHASCVQNTTATIQSCIKDGEYKKAAIFALVLDQLKQD